MPARRILVTGATGAQGGSVAAHLLARGEVAVRCLTRHPESARASELRAEGAELVRGDLADPASLRRALAGCWGVFGVTNFWEHFEREYEHGKNLLDAVAESSVQFLVLSTLPSVERITRGELHVPHFDLKARLEDDARSFDLPAAFIHVAFYYENFLSFFPPRRQRDGSYLISFPQGETPLAAVAVEDVGGVVSALFDRPEEFRRRTVGLVGDERRPASYAEILSRVLGCTVKYESMSREQFAGLGFHGASELADMFEFYRRHVRGRQAEMEESRSLYPAIQNFEQWASRHRWQFRSLPGFQVAA